MTWSDTKTVAESLLEDLRAKYTAEEIRLILRALSRAWHTKTGERTAPEGYRSVEHFLDDLREYCERHTVIGGMNQYSPRRELAAYLQVNESSVRKWFKREKTPMQDAIEGMARWYESKKRGL